MASPRTSNFNIAEFVEFLNALIRGLKLIVYGYQTSGYTIRWQDRSCFLYTEGDHKVLIVGEMLNAEVDFVIYTSSIQRWEPPYENEALDAPKQREILDRLKLWMDRGRMSYRIDRGSDPDVRIIHL